MHQDTGACGTVRPNRKGLPKVMKQTKLKKGDLPKMWLTEDKALLACTWQDTGKVNMLSTIGDSSVTDMMVKKRTGPTVVPKPSIQVLYRKHMGGVDKFDQLCGSYNFNQRSKKWYQILWRFVIEVALVNGRICYNAANSGAAVNQTAFRERLIDGLLQGYERKRSSKVGRPFTTLALFALSCHRPAQKKEKDNANESKQHISALPALTTHPFAFCRVLKFFILAKSTKKVAVHIKGSARGKWFYFNFAFLLFFVIFIYSQVQLFILVFVYYKYIQLLLYKQCLYL